MTGQTYGTASGSTYSGSSYGTLEGVPEEIGTGWWVDGYRVTALEGNHPSLTLGEEASYTFRLSPEYRGDTRHIRRYERLRGYLSHAGSAAVWKDIEGDVAYREQHQQEQSLVLPIEPGEDVHAAQGIWGLLMGGSDETNRPRQQCRLELSLVYLAHLDEYDNREEVAESLEVSL